MPILVHRKASEIDYELLRSMRVECGWGLEKLEKYWNDPHRVYCVFQTDSGSDVGMGCWILEDEDPELASKATDSVYISSLFIRREFQGFGLGKQAMDLLERIAKEEFGARWITLDTWAYFAEPKEDGIYYEDQSRPGVNIAYYNTRGYVQFKDHKAVFPHPTPEEPDRLLWATFLRKKAT